LFSSRHFFISVSTSIGTKKGRIYIKGASFNGEPQTFRLRSALRKSVTRQQGQFIWNWGPWHP